MNHLYLYGAPASGKTTLGRALAAKTRRQFIDLDALITERDGRLIPEIFAADGESVFRRLESEALRSITSEDAVIALGGGTLLDDANRAWCEERGNVVCIDTPGDEELARRISSAAGSRPLGDRAAERAEHYASFPRRLSRTFEIGDSLVAVGSGIAFAIAGGLPRFVDGNVAALYGLDGAPETLAVIAPGEEFKTPATVMKLWSALARGGLGRKDVIAAFGGGVTGDLSGFAAATWMRGMDWINVPTTLLAMVDASTGGKTGCDLPEGKNLVGAFQPPRLVVIDTDFLKTLSGEILRDGKAEMIKHTVIAGGECEFSAIPTAAQIADNLAVKVDIVREDPFEKTGLRMKLNCGHTVGHAVETLSGYRLSHGSAVAIGCVAEAEIAARKNIAPASWPARLARSFAAAGLATEIPPEITFARMREVIACDKKRAHGKVTFALPCGWGDVRLVEIDPAEEFGDEN